MSVCVCVFELVAPFLFLNHLTYFYETCLKHYATETHPSMYILIS
jgi:hypothetical protein